MMNDKLRIKILSYWIENTGKTSKIPDNLKNKIDEDDVKDLINEMNLNYGSFIAYRRELEKDVKSSRRHREIIKFQKTQVLFTEILALATLVLALNVFREAFGIKANPSNLLIQIMSVLTIGLFVIVFLVLVWKTIKYLSSHRK